MREDLLGSGCKATVLLTTARSLLLERMALGFRHFLIFAGLLDFDGQDLATQPGRDLYTLFVLDLAVTQVGEEVVGGLAALLCISLSELVEFLAVAIEFGHHIIIL